MKTYKHILLASHVLIEIFAIVLFVSKKMNANTFFLICTSMIKVKPITIMSALLLALTFTSCSSYLNLSENKKNNYRLDKFSLSALEDNKHLLYSIKKSDIKNTLKKMSDDKLLLLVFFTSWCPNFEEKKEEILTFTRQIDKYQTLFITPDDWIFQERYDSNLRKDLGCDVFMIDMNSPNSSKKMHTRQEEFITSLCGSCQEKTGFPLIIVMNNKSKVIINTLLINNEIIDLE